MKLIWALDYAQRKAAQGQQGAQNYGIYQGTVQKHNQDGSVIVKLDDGSVTTITPTSDDVLWDGVRVWVMASNVGFLAIGTVK